MKYHKGLDSVITDMRSMGEMLIPHSFPHAPPADEEDIYLLRVRETIIDGYPVVLYFGIVDYGESRMETAQIFGKTMPFLPFGLVVKVAKKFLGSDCLSLVELPKDNRKVYCWTVYTNASGDPIILPYEVEFETCNYEGFEYSYVQPNQVNLI